MDQASKKKIAAIIIFAHVLVIGLLILVAGSLSKNDMSAKTGIFKSDAQIAADSQPIRQSEQDRNDEYESREEMPQMTEENFYVSISQFLSAGNFTEMDNLLRYWQETYKDSTDETESKTAVIERYRGDLSYYIGIANGKKALDIWQFKTADTLAACVSYTPIMQKYNAFIDQDSVLFPAIQEGFSIHLSKTQKTNEELAVIKGEVNRTKTDENIYQQIEVYDLTLYGYPCQFIAVMDRDSMTWMPYSLKVTNNMIDLPTVSLGKELLRSNPNCNLDVSIAIPTMISERPNGMDGNIDRAQEGMPSSDTMEPINIGDPYLEDNILTGPAEAEYSGEAPRNVPGKLDSVQR